MAQFDSGVFGFLRGKVGTLISRLRYGKVYVAAKPLKHNIQSEKLKLAQKVFSRRQRLNTQLRKDKKIQAFWKAVDTEGLNDNTKLMKRNQPFVAYECILPGCGFTPLSDDKIIVKNVHFEKYEIVFDFKLERANPKKLEPPYDVYCILLLDRYFKNSGSGLIRHKMIFGETGFCTFESETGDSFQEFRYKHEGTVNRIRMYAEKAYVMVAAIKFNELKNKYEWSDTYFEELFDYVPEEEKTKWDTRKYIFHD